MVKKKEICISCRREMFIHGKSMCNTCYKKKYLKPKIVICKRCKRNLPYHAKGYCNGCYNFVFHIDNIKAWNRKKYHNIDPETYKEKTKECVVCGFNKVVELHHLDNNHHNNSKENLVGLCPNHHKMYHNLKYQAEIEFRIKQNLLVQNVMLP